MTVDGYTIDFGWSLASRSCSLPQDWRFKSPYRYMAGVYLWQPPGCLKCSDYWASKKHSQRNNKHQMSKSMEHVLSGKSSSKLLKHDFWVTKVFPPSTEPVRKAGTGKEWGSVGISLGQFYWDNFKCPIIYESYLANIMGRQWDIILMPSSY